MVDAQPVRERKDRGCLEAVRIAPVHVAVRHRVVLVQVPLVLRQRLDLVDVHRIEISSHLVVLRQIGIACVRLELPSFDHFTRIDRHNSLDDDVWPTSLHEGTVGLCTRRVSTESPGGGVQKIVAKVIGEVIVGGFGQLVDVVPEGGLALADGVPVAIESCFVFREQGLVFLQLKDEVVSEQGLLIIRVMIVVDDVSHYFHETHVFLGQVDVVSVVRGVVVLVEGPPDPSLP